MRPALICLALFVASQFFMLLGAGFPLGPVIVCLYATSDMRRIYRRLFAA